MMRASLLVPTFLDGVNRIRNGARLRALNFMVDLTTITVLLLFPWSLVAVAAIGCLKEQRRRRVAQPATVSPTRPLRLRG